MKPNRCLTLVAALVSLFTTFTFTASAAIRIWDGSASGYWTNAANWTANIVPTNGDGLVFPANAARLVMTNTAGAATNFTFLQFLGSNYVLYGGVLFLTNGLTNATVAP